MLKMITGLMACGLVAGCFLIQPTDSAAEDKKVLATTPAAKSESGWWPKRHAEKLAEVKAKKGNVDLLFIGDSITHAWENKGKKLFDEYYGKRKPFNIGYSGDRTENVLYRLAHGEVDGISPKLAVIMIGTNNTGHREDPPAETAAGIKAILDDLRERLPETKLLLLGVFPRSNKPEDKKRKINDDINKIISKYDDGKMIHYLDINHIFLEEDGTLPKSIMPDFLHPNVEGYKKWADAMEPTISKLMK